MDEQATDPSIGQPIGKQTPLWIWARWFFSAFGIAFSALWAGFEAFDVWRLVFQADAWGPWIALVLTSVLIAGLFSSFRLLEYYRHLYRLYRDRALVDNFYADRSTLQGKYATLISNAEHHITVSGISLHTLLQNPDTRAAIVKAATERNVHFRFLLHSPNCKFIRARALQESKNEDHIAKDCSLHLQQLDNIRQECVNRGGSVIEIRTITDKMPDCFFFEVDDTLYVEPYLLGYTGRDCPIFSIKKNAINSTVFDSFMRRINYKWDKLATEVDRAPAPSITPKRPSL